MTPLDKRIGVKVSLAEYDHCRSFYRRRKCPHGRCIICGNGKHSAVHLGSIDDPHGEPAGHRFTERSPGGET